MADLSSIIAGKIGIEVSIDGKPVINAVNGIIKEIDKISPIVDKTGKNFSKTISDNTEILNKMSYASGKLRDNLQAAVKSSFADFNTLAQNIDAFKGKLNNLNNYLENKILSSFKNLLTNGGAILTFIGPFTKIGDNFNKMSGRTGAGTEFLSEMGHAANLCGTNLEALEQAFKKISQDFIAGQKGSQEVIGTYKQLGLSFEYLSALSPEERFEALRKAIREIKNPTEQAGIAMKVFGESGGKMLNLINSSEDAISGMRKEAQKLGVSFSSESAQKAADLADAIEKGKQALLGLGYTISKTIAPAVISSIDSLKRWAERLDEIPKYFSSLGNVLAWFATRGVGVTVVVGSFWMALLVGTKVMTSFMSVIDICSKSINSLKTAYNTASASLETFRKKNDMSKASLAGWGVGITAAIALIGFLIYKINDAVSAHEKLSFVQRDAAKKNTDKLNKETEQFKYLKELSLKNSLSNEELNKARKILDTLRSKYYDIGIEIDSNNKKIIMGYDEEEKHAKHIRDQKLIDLKAEEIENEKNIKNQEFKMNRAGGSGIFALDLLNPISYVSDGFGGIVSRIFGVETRREQEADENYAQYKELLEKRTELYKKRKAIEKGDTESALGKDDDIPNTNEVDSKKLDNLKKTVADLREQNLKSGMTEEQRRVYDIEKTAQDYRKQANDAIAEELKKPLKSQRMDIIENARALITMADAYETAEKKAIAEKKAVEEANAQKEEADKIARELEDIKERVRSANKARGLNEPETALAKELQEIKNVNDEYKKELKNLIDLLLKKKELTAEEQKMLVMAQAKQRIVDQEAKAQAEKAMKKAVDEAGFKGAMDNDEKKEITDSKLKNKFDNYQKKYDSALASGNFALANRYKGVMNQTQSASDFKDFKDSQKKFIDESKRLQAAYNRALRSGDKGDIEKAEKAVDENRNKRFESEYDYATKDYGMKRMMLQSNYGAAVASGNTWGAGQIQNQIKGLDRQQNFMEYRKITLEISQTMKELRKAQESGTKEQIAEAYIKLGGLRDKQQDAVSKMEQLKDDPAGTIADQVGGEMAKVTKSAAGTFSAYEAGSMADTLQSKIANNTKKSMEIAKKSYQALNEIASNTNNGSQARFA